MAEIKGVGNKKPSRRPRGVSNQARRNGKAWKRHPKSFNNITRSLSCVEHSH